MSSLRIVYFGTSNFAVPPLQALFNLKNCEVVAVVTRPDKPTGRKQTIKSSPVTTLSKNIGLKILTPTKLKTEEFYNELKELKADFFIVAAYGKILPQNILDLPRFGSLNLHGSLLPKYRGASPIQAAIIDGAKKTGVTLMLMDAEMDHGPIFEKQSIAIAFDDTFETMEDKLSKIAAEMIVSNLSLIVEKKIKTVEQEHSSATYTKIINKEDGKINWFDDAEKISNKLHAYDPWPGLYTFWKHDNKSLRLAIKQIEIVENTNHEKPGSIFKSTDGYPVVTTKKSALKIKKIQPEGKRLMDGRDFLNGYRDLTGSTFESNTP